MALGLVQSLVGGAYNTPGPQYVVPNNALGNLAMVFAAWDVSQQVTSGNGVIPVGAVTDDAENWWRLVGDSGNLVPGCRIACWVCANALPSTRWLSFCPQGYVTSFTYIFAEFSGLPANYWPLVDFLQSVSSASANAANVSGTAGVADFAFTLGALGSTGATASQGSGGWTTITTAQQGGANPNGIKLTAQFGTFAAGAVPSTWSYSAVNMIAAMTVGLTQASNLPVQINPNFPRVFVDAAFGATPGDPTTAILDSAYTDLSSFCIGPAGQSIISASHGRTYELAQPESGSCTVAMNNRNGEFNPSNSLSPFFPNVLPGVPIRVSAQYAGRRYPLWAGYVERWPQDWPEMPQWGWSNMIATDGVGVASSANLPSAVQGEISADNPYYCFPFGEQYTTSQNTINGVVKSATATDGLLAVNTSPTNQATATYIDGATQPVVTGQSLGFQGDSGTGMGASGFSGLDLSGFRGPGAQYGPDAGMPKLIANGAGDATFEFWFFPPTQTAPGTTQNVQLFELLIPPYLGSNGAADLGGGVFIMGGISYRSDGTMAWYTQEAWAGAVTAIVNIAEGVLHHFVLIMSNGVLTFWLDGTNFGTIGSMPMPVSLVATAFGLSTYSYGNHGANSNFSMAYATMYPYVLQANRIGAHYLSGNNGFNQDTQIQRAGRYLAWGRLNLGLGGPTTFDHILLSAAYSTANSPLSSALNADAVSSGGLWFVNGSGNLVVLPREYLYDRPTSVIFGDNVAGGEIPYESDTGFDFDNTYLQNSAQATLQQGPNSLATPVVRDFTSAGQYFQRGPLQQNVSAGSVEDATDRATWSLNKYKQPSLRVRQMKVNLAARPAAIQAVLQTGLTDTAQVNRRPLGRGSYSLPVVVGRVQHDIGPGKWETTYQMYPGAPENATLLVGWQFTTSGVPGANSFFVVSTSQAAQILVGDQFTDVNNPGVTFTVTSISAPFAGFNNVSYTPNAATLMSSPDVVTQNATNVLGSNTLAW